MAEGEVQNQSGESLEDRVFTFAAMAGAVGGAVGGTVLGAAVGTAYPIACGAGHDARQRIRRRWLVPPGSTVVGLHPE